MLTVDFGRLGVGPGELVLDLGCGAGRHAVEAARLGAWVVAADLSPAAAVSVAASGAAAEELLGARLRGGPPLAVAADATSLPFADRSVDVVIASEILEHVAEDGSALAEIARVVRPGGRVAISVPRRLPEAVCWRLSPAYHSIEGGHLRIYGGAELRRRVADAGLEVDGWSHAHALHTPYWWLRCALGVHDQPGRAPVRLYHRLLVWDMMRRPRSTRGLERLLNPLLGKSLVVYATRPAVEAMPVRVIPASAPTPLPTTTRSAGKDGDGAAAA